MAKVNPKEMKRQRDKLVPEDLEGGEAIALTIASVEHVKFDDRKALAITFEETGEKSLWPNGTSAGYIVEVYGDEDDDWIGRPLPIMVKSGTFNGEAFTNLQVPAPELWNAILEASNFDAVVEEKDAPKPKPKARAVVKKSAKRGR